MPHKLIKLMMLVTLLLLTACSDPVRDDLRAYQDFIREIATLESETTHLKIINSEGVKASEQLKIYESQLLPKQELICAKLKFYTPKTPEVVELNQKFISHCQMELKLTQSSIQNLKQRKQETATETVPTSTLTLEAAASELAALKEKHGLN